MTNFARTLGALVAASLIAGCGGGGRTTPPTAAAIAGPKGQLARASITVVVPAPRPASRGRRPAYVSSSTQSMTVAVNGGAPVAMNLTPSSPGCVPGPTTCTLGVDAPVGTDTFAVRLYDAAGGTGNVLSSATVQQTIVLNAGNVVRLTLDGVVQAISIAQQGGGAVTFAAGTARSFAIALTARDAKGNTIVGPGAYLDASGAPLSIAISLRESGSTSSTFALSSTTVTGPSDSTIRMTYNGKSVDDALLSARGAGGLSDDLLLNAAPSVVMTTHSPTNSAGTGIVPMPDGSVWVAEAGIGANDYIAHVTPSGAITEFPVTGNISPNGIALGSDGNVWFAETNSFNIGRITPSGAFTQFPVTFSEANQIALGPDGNTWATYVSSGITKMTTAGVPTDYSAGFTPGSVLNGIVAGPDGRMWVCEQGGNAIDAVSTNGAVTSYAIPTAAAKPFGITVAAGKLWFTESGSGKLASITTSGTIVEYPIPGPGLHAPQGITLAPDGQLWFVDRGNATINSFHINGAVFTTFDSSASSLGFFIASAPDGTLWYTDGGNRNILTMVY